MCVVYIRYCRQGITNYMVIYGACVRFWPTLFSVSVLPAFTLQLVAVYSTPPPALSNMLVPANQHAFASTLKHSHQHANTHLYQHPRLLPPAR